MRNSKEDLDLTTHLSKTERRFQPFFPLTTLLTPWTGETKVPSPPSRTKDLADHAGLSLPLDLSKVPIKSKLENLSPSPSNNLLTAPLMKETKDAMVDLWMTLSLISKATLSCLRLTTDIPEELEKLAKRNHPRVSLKLLASMMLKNLLTN